MSKTTEEVKNIIAGLARVYCPPPPMDTCPGQPVTTSVCEHCWEIYIDTLASVPSGDKEVRP